MKGQLFIHQTTRLMRTLLNLKIQFLLLFLLFVFGNINAQTSQIDSLKYELIQTARDTNTVIILNKISFKYYSLDRKEALKYAEQAYELSNELMYAKGIAESLYKMAGALMYLSHFDQAKRHYRECIKLFTELDDKSGISKSRSALGNLFVYTGSLDSAMLNYEQILEYYIAANNMEAIGQTYNGIATMYSRQGKSKEALENFIKASNAFEKLHMQEGILQSYINIGSTYYDLGSYEMSLDYFERSLKLSKSIGSKAKTSYALSGLGKYYMIKNEYEIALGYFNESLAIKKGLGDIHGAASTLMDISTLSTQFGKYDNALAYSMEYLNLSEEIGDKDGIASAYISIGNDYLSLGKFQDALEHLKTGLKLAQEIKNDLVLKGAYDGLRITYAELGDFQRAFGFATRYQQLNDTLFNVEKSQQIAEMQTKYETEKKEQQITLLEKDSEIQKASIENQKLIRNAGIGFFAVLILVGVLVFNRYKLKQSNDRNLLEKNIVQTENQLLRAQMNPHFIFNSLNSIQGFVADNKTNLGQEYLADFAKLMRAILENSTKEMISLSGELEVLSIYLKLEQLRFEGKFEYTINSDAVEEADLIEIPPMIIQPFVENAILHGVMNKPDIGHISILVREADDQLICEVTDDGIGREASAKLGKNNKHKSIGLEVTQNRIALLSKETGIEGGVEVNDLIDDTGQVCGTSVVVTLPIGQYA